jgi:hypothetical protein
MSDDRKSTSAAGGARGYKRSWKNLLINKRYQLRFTLFMVGMAALLMTGLGVWVMRVADEATEVAASRVRGEGCPALPEIGQVPAEGDAAAPKRAGDGGAPAEPTNPDAPPEERRRRVVIEESTMTINPVPARFAEEVAAHYECELRQAARLDELEHGRTRILYVLFAAGVLLVLGLAVYGIKMTHKVAGPLYKITLYMGKMREGRYDKVYNLRKGDQLVDFYEHFRHAHEGVVDLEKADIARLKSMIATAEKQQGASAELDAALGDLRAILARKEKSLE